MAPCPPPTEPHRDVWVSLLFTLAQLVTLVLGLVHWARGNTETPLIISLVYMIYNLVPQYLLLQVLLAGGCGVPGQARS